MMPTTQDASRSANSQEQCQLFRVPLEIRQYIYALFINRWGYHIVSSLDGELALTPCLGASLFNGEIGKERRFSAFARPGSEYYRIYERRVASSWGPHWMCEEYWISGQAPVVTCKKKYGLDIPLLYPFLGLCKRTSVQQNRMNNFPRLLALTENQGMRKSWDGPLPKSTSTSWTWRP